METLTYCTKHKEASTICNLFSNSLRSNENNLIYFRKQMGNKENERFLLIEPCSLVTCCEEINLQLLFVKYLSI